MLDLENAHIHNGQTTQQPLTSKEGGLVAEDLVGLVEGVGPDEVHLRLLATLAEDVLALLARHHGDGAGDGAAVLALLVLCLQRGLEPLDLGAHGVQDALHDADVAGEVVVDGVLDEGVLGLQVARVLAHQLPIACQQKAKMEGKLVQTKIQLNISISTLVS